MSSRYGSLVLAVGSGGFAAPPEPVVTSLPWAGFAASGPVVTSLAGFEDGRVLTTAPTSCRPYRNPCGLQISAGSLPADAGFLLNSTQRPAQLAERDHLFLLFFVQDIAHVDGGYSLRLSNVLTTFSLAGFQVTTIGRFWVTAEACRGAENLPMRLRSRNSSVCRTAQNHQDARVVSHRGSRFQAAVPGIGAGGGGNGKPCSTGSRCSTIWTRCAVTGSAKSVD